MSCAICKLVGLTSLSLIDKCSVRTGLKLSTYFSAIKLRWMIDNCPEVKKAHAEDVLLFGTVESWVAYVGDAISLFGM